MTDTDDTAIPPVPERFPEAAPRVPRAAERAVQHPPAGARTEQAPPPPARMREQIAQAFSFGPIPETPRRRAPETPAPAAASASSASSVNSVPSAPSAPAGESRKEISAETAHTLLEIMSMPDSAAQPQERTLAAHALAQMLPEGAPERVYRELGRRLILMAEPPLALLKAVFSRATPEVAGEVLSEARVPEQTLLDIIASGTERELERIVRRRDITTAISDAICARGEPRIVMELLRNSGAAIHEGAFWRILRMAETNEFLHAPLATRRDLPPSVAFELFWTLSAPLRRHVISRFLGNSGTLDRILPLVLPARPSMPADERGVRIETFIGLLAEGETASAARKMMRLSGLSERACMRIAADGSGEPLAVILKALGYSRSLFPAAMRRIISSPVGPVRSGKDAEELQTLFEAMSYPKAWMLLLYWDWAARGTGPYAGVDTPR